MAPAKAMASANQTALQAAASLNLTTARGGETSQGRAQEKISTQIMKPASARA